MYSSCKATPELRPIGLAVRCRAVALLDHPAGQAIARRANEARRLQVYAVCYDVPQVAYKFGFSGCSVLPAI